jgi:thiopurine S-methyltransferase
VDPQFWHDRWQDNRIAFHKDRTNHYLEQYFHRLNLGAGDHVLVPLCGKSVDMIWLRDRGCTVSGVELSDIAVRDFFNEQGITAHRREDGAFQILEGGGIELLAGDFFALEARHVKKVSAVYDRAALVALPADMRRRYVDHLLSLLAPEIPILLLTFEYPPAQIDGPPFSVDEAQVRALFAGRREITRLESLDRLADEAALAERGLTELVEHAFVLSAA